MEFLNNFYILPKLARKRARKKIRNKNITIFCSNCIGGIIYHELGMHFMSPTINLRIYSNDFIRFLLNINAYLEKKLEFIEPTEGCPAAMLGDVLITFTHFSNNKEAEVKWEERKKRINWNNVYIILNDRDNVTEDNIRSLDAVPCKNIVVFTSQKYESIPYTFQITEFFNEPCVGDLISRSRITGMRKYEQYFDYVAWLNNTKGDNERFRKK